MALIAKNCALQASASIAKLTYRLSGSTPNPSPDRIIDVPSRDQGRTIKTNAYEPSTQPSGPSAVLVNFHGSGWILPCHGESDHYCRTITQSTEYTVLDASYRLAPTTPFPGAQNDGEDVIRYVLANPDLYDSSRIVLSGFSAGGHTALVLASTTFPANTFSKLILFYPALNLSIDPYTMEDPEPTIPPAISPEFLSLVIAAYIQDQSLDTKDPRISPIFASLDSLPKDVAVFTAGADNLMPEAERLVEKLKASGDRSITYRKFDKCNHAFDVSPKPDSIEQKAQQEAYSIVVKMLQT